MGACCGIKKQPPPLQNQYQPQRPPAKSEIEGRYRLLETIRTSAFITVRKAVFQATGQFRLVEMIHKAAYKQGEAHPRLQEATILRALDHPNIARLVDAYEDSSSIYLYSEYSNGSPLLDFLSSQSHLSEAVAADIMQQILSAVQYCHAQRIVHRDLRPEHIWVEMGRNRCDVKIMDFGCAAVIDPRRQLVGIFGSAYFLAPEVLRGFYTELCDLWSCGVLMYLLLFGRYPFVGREIQVLQDLLTGRAQVEIGTEGSIEARQLLSRLLRNNPKERVNAREALQHPWFAVVGKERGEAADLSPVIQRLKSFTSQNKLRDAVLTFISTKVVSQAEMSHLRDAFRVLDRNGDGVLSAQEIAGAANCALSPEEQKQVMDRVDTNGDGKISYSEFLRAAGDQRELLSRQTLENAFRSIDSDGNGIITVAELKKVFPDGMGTDTEWQNLLAQADRSGDGALDLREFTSLLLQSS